MRVISAIITIATLAVVLWVVALESDRLTSPGPLHASHATIAELTGGAGCIACHGAEDQTMTDACVGCHVDVGRQVSELRSLHGQLDGDTINDCQTCHREHNDGSIPLVSPVSFQAAGIADPDIYDHRHVDEFSLADRHDELNCVTCHRQANVPSLRSGERRFMGLEQACVACHADPHETTYGDDCASCHGQAHAFDQVAMFEHVDAFPLVGGHDDLACKQCHATEGAHAIAALRETPRDGRTCVECHESPHRQVFLASVDGDPHDDQAADCEQCHAATHDTFLSPPARMTPELHARAGFPLGPPHDQLECAACHSASFPMAAVETRVIARTFEQRFPGREAGDCIACHVDPHTPTFGTDCVSCHGATHPFAEAASFSHDASLPLTDAHGDLECVACHDAGGAHSVLALRTGPHDERGCVDCHASTHRPTFLEQVAARLQVEQIESCEHCHEAAHDGFAWPAATLTPEWHEATGFPLLSPHDGIECLSCHAEFTTPHRLARGTVSLPRGAARQPDTCVACHADPHAGQFDRGGVDRSCLDCHSAEHFVPNTFDLARHDAGRFSLTGAHRAVACRSCHEVVDDVRRFTPLATNCADCHTDVHQGRYARDDTVIADAGQTDCTQCHTTRSFTEVPVSTESHLLWSDYELRGAHATATCGDCHPRRAEPDPFGMSIGRASTNCDSCHNDPHVGQFVVDQVNDCARCHSETSSFSPPDFDHQRDSQFALDEFHRTLDCGDCHQPMRLATGATVVRYRPLGTACADCHGLRPE